MKNQFTPFGHIDFLSEQNKIDCCSFFLPKKNQRNHSTVLFSFVIIYVVVVVVVVVAVWSHLILKNEIRTPFCFIVSNSRLLFQFQNYLIQLIDCGKIIVLFLCTRPLLGLFLGYEDDFVSIFWKFSDFFHTFFTFVVVVQFFIIQRRATDRSEKTTK